MRNDTVPTPSKLSRLPAASDRPPEPAPQARAWRRALKVIGYAPPRRAVRSAKTPMRGVAH